jgi:hypothetical protein
VTDEDDAAEMSPEDLALWSGALTLAEIGELTAQWLEGRIASIPTVVPGVGPDEETGPLIPVLAACNRAGFVTTVSQPGETPILGCDGEMWTQRAAVEGFATTATLEALRACTTGTPLLLMASPAGSTERNWDSRIPVTMDGDQENTWFGVTLSRSDIEEEQAGYGICHPQAVEAICAAWQIVLVDPEWGRNDVLWPALEAFAASAPACEWASIGDVSADHGEILIIANHGVPVAPADDSPWDRFIGYKVVSSERGPDGTTENFVADICSPGWESPVAAEPLHAREDALIVRTGKGSAYDVQARRCAHPGHAGWCEVRILLHNHVGEDDNEESDVELTQPRHRRAAQRPANAIRVAVPTEVAT